METKPPVTRTRPLHMKRNFFIMIVFLGLVFGGLFAYHFIGMYFMNKFFNTQKQPPVTISATKAEAKTWKPYLTAVGKLVASDGVDLSSEASGLVMKIYYKAGQMVNVNEPLVQLDDRENQQDLKNFQAQQKLAQITYNRMKALFAKKATSKSSLDEAQAKLDETTAMVEKTKVIIDHKLIKAPFSGKIGISGLNVGQYVTPGDKLVSLQALDPLYIEFYMPEQYLKQIYTDQPVVLNVDTFKDQAFHAKIYAINSTVDPKTHNILVRAIIRNDDNKLYPGLFADIKVILPEQQNVITVPQTSISYSLYGDNVYVIHKDPKEKDKDGKPVLKAKRTYVTLGDRRGDEVAIKEGVKEGDLVVTSGQLKLQDETPVLINNSVKLSPRHDTLY